MKWEPGAREDDAINRASVDLAKRYRGHVINEKANKDAKVEALANTNSKAKDHASVGGEEFKAYAFGLLAVPEFHGLLGRAGSNSRRD